MGGSEASNDGGQFVSMENMDVKRGPGVNVQMQMQRRTNLSLAVSEWKKARRKEEVEIGSVM